MKTKEGGIMKKPIFIFLLVLGLSVFNIMQASAECTIVWTGDRSGSVVTQESSRTQQATSEAFDSIFGGTPTGFSDNCYYYSYYYNNPRIIYETIIEKVCIDGTWSYYQYVEGRLCPFGCTTNEAGSWDVVGECTTTTTTTILPTIIELSSFIATPKAEKVILQWSTESETNNSGFNLYRSESENGHYIKINSTMIQAQGSSTQGAAYEFTDNNVSNRKTYYYKLEDIDLSGTSTMHGPVIATPRWVFGFIK
jgi:hypothetical protein